MQTWCQEFKYLPLQNLCQRPLLWSTVDETCCDLNCSRRPIETWHPLACRASAPPCACLLSWVFYGLLCLSSWGCLWAAASASWWCPGRRGRPTRLVEMNWVRGNSYTVVISGMSQMGMGMRTSSLALCPITRTPTNHTRKSSGESLDISSFWLNFLYKRPEISTKNCYFSYIYSIYIYIYIYIYKYSIIRQDLSI